MSSIHRIVMTVGLLAAAAGVASAGQTSTSTATKKFEVIAVDGNQLVVKLPEGTREITVPPDFRFTVDGKQLSVQQLKPGMAGTATITTTTNSTPVTVTEVKNGTVVQASGASIIVRTDEGFKMFTQGEVDKRGVKIMRAGKPAVVSDFRSGDKLSAVFITSMPPKIVTQQEVNATLAASGSGAAATGSGAAATGARPPAASASGTAGAAGAPSGARPAGASGGAGAAGATRGAATPAAAGASSARRLPKTASPLPLLGLLGSISLLAGSGLTIRRRYLSRR